METLQFRQRPHGRECVRPYDFADAYTAKGGISQVIDIPKEGITGNDRFIFQDLNNDVVADHVENWIQENVG